MRKADAVPGSATVVDLATFHPNRAEMRAIRGGEISMVFQEPMTSFSPVHTIGNQIDRSHPATSGHHQEKRRTRWPSTSLRQVGISRSPSSA